VDRTNNSCYRLEKPFTFILLAKLHRQKTTRAIGSYLLPSAIDSYQTQTWLSCNTLELRLKLCYQSQFFNVDAKRLTAGYRQGNRVASALLRVPRLAATGATQRQERDA